MSDPHCNVSITRDFGLKPLWFDEIRAHYLFTHIHIVAHFHKKVILLMKMYRFIRNSQLLSASDLSAIVVEFSWKGRPVAGVAMGAQCMRPTCILRVGMGAQCMRPTCILRVATGAQCMRPTCILRVATGAQCMRPTCILRVATGAQCMRPTCILRVATGAQCMRPTCILRR